LLAPHQHPQLTRLRANERGVTLTELLVAMAVMLILVTAITSSFIAITRRSAEAQARLRATTAARSAVDKIATEVRTLPIDPDPAERGFRVTNTTLAWGDGLDNDSDGVFDEEELNGIDDDGDWSIADDRHISIGSFSDRQRLILRPDLGDNHVDEDNRFSEDILYLYKPAEPPDVTCSGKPAINVTYRVQSFAGEDNVLVREVFVADATLVPCGGTVTTEPVLFGVVSFDVLAWNINDDSVVSSTGIAYWVPNWDSNAKVPPLKPLNAPVGVLPFEHPGAVYISITVNADRLPLDQQRNWITKNNGLNVITISTIVTIEGITQDPDNRYFLYVRD